MKAYPLKFFLIFLFALFIILSPSFSFLNSGNGTTEIEIRRGWNLISPANLEIDFSEIQNQNPKCKIIKNQKWTSNEEYIAVAKLQGMEGYWVYSDFQPTLFKKTCKVKISGKESQNEIILSKGWNQISSKEKKSFNEINIDCHPFNDKLWWYDPKNNDKGWYDPKNVKYFSIGLDEPLDPKKGYWLWAPNSCRIGKTGPGPKPLPADCPPNSIPPDEQNDKKVDWRCREWKGRVGNWLSEVRDQGHCGACWAFAILAGVEAQAEINKGDPDLNLDLSEKFLVCCLGALNPCTGNHIHLGLYYLSTWGVPPEELMPYFDSLHVDCSAQECNEVLKEKDKFYKADSKEFSGEVTEILKNHGPIIATIEHMPSIGLIDENGFLHCTGGGSPHAVLLVGYNFEDPNNSYWIVKNSGGEEVGDHGFIYIRINEPNCNLTYNNIIENVYSP